MAHPGGRPTKYKAEYCQLATNYCLLGATDENMAGYFGVSVATFNNWKNYHPEFLEALKKGREEADANVGKRLYERAMGYTHDHDEIFCSNGKVTKVKTLKHYPPETAAIAFWLKNRQPAIWRDKHEVELSGSIDLAHRLSDARRRVGGDNGENDETAI